MKIGLLILVGVTLAVTIGVTYYAQSTVLVASGRAAEAKALARQALEISSELTGQVHSTTKTTQEMEKSVVLMSEKVRQVTEIMDQYERLVFSWQDQGVKERQKLTSVLRRELRGAEDRQLRSIEDLSDELLSLIVLVESIDRRLIALSLVEAPTPPSVVDVVDVVDEGPVKCPTTALNADAKKSILRRAMERASDTGTHAVSGSFNIDSEGKTTDINVTSDTAPSRLRTAVRKYLNALVWEPSADGHSGCEIQLRLEVS